MADRHLGAEHYSQYGLGDVHAIALDFVGYNQRVLEFGCAAGHVTQALAERGCSVVGLELDPAAAEVAGQHAEEVLVLDLDSDDYATKLSGRVFDVALFGDVLEHLKDPLSMLRSVRHLLAPGTGFVVLSVPNIAHVDVRLALLQGRFDYGPWGLLDETHLRFFTRASLDRFVDRAGLAPVELQRVLRPAFETELGVERDSVEPAVLAAALSDSEAETYQFVMKAVPFDGANAVANLGGRVLRLEDEIRTTRIAHAVELADAERRVEEAVGRLEDAERRLEEAGRRADEAERRAGEAGRRADEAERRADEAERRADEASQANHAAALKAARSDSELESLRRTRLFRWSSPLRRLYARVLRRSPHRD